MYTILKKKALTSNKPPEPNPVPDSNLFPTQLEMYDGRKVWISIPQPDKLSLTVPIHSKVMGEICPDDHPPAEIAKGIGGYLVSEPWNSHIISHKMHYGKPTYHRVNLRMGKRGAAVHFTFLNCSKYGHRLQIECNPRKLGQSGMLQLTKVLVGSDPIVHPNELFSPSHFAQNAKLTRLDIAVDLVGIPVEQITAWHKHQGKRSYYTANDGTLETHMVHRKKKLPSKKYEKDGTPKKITHSSNPSGKTLIKIYDRLKERAAVLKPPPYGAAPISRIEVVKNRFIGKYLVDVPHISDPFTDIRVGWTEDQVELGRPLFTRYAALRRSMNALSASTALGVTPNDVATFEKALEVPKPHFIERKTNWTLWKEGLEQSGLSILINAKDFNLSNAHTVIS